MSKKINGDDVVRTLKDNIASNFNLLARMDYKLAVEVAQSVATQVEEFFGDDDDKPSES